jgi:hypothetical protein
MERNRIINKLNKRNQHTIISPKLYKNKIQTSPKPIRIVPFINIDNRFYFPIEMSNYSTALKQYNYYQHLALRPEFYRKMFPPLKLLSWEKKNQRPPRPVTTQTRNKFSYCSNQPESVITNHSPRRRNNFRDKFRYSTPIPEKEIIITLYNMKLNEKIPFFWLAKLLKEFREEIIVQTRSYHIAIDFDKYTEQKNG